MRLVALWSLGDAAGGAEVLFSLLPVSLSSSRRLQLSWQPLGLRTLDRETHAVGRLDVLSAWTIIKSEVPLLGWKEK
jgi:hypothetical protein